jgi:hypothetical protein
MKETPENEELIADYLRNGWQLNDPRDAEDTISFVPDILLKKGNDYLVIEVKAPGEAPERSVADMRKAVEQRPNWHFEVKIRPPRKLSPENEIAVPDLPSRLSLIEDLVKEGHQSEAALIAWVAIETSLRQILSQLMKKQPELGLPRLIQNAYEEDIISDTERRLIGHVQNLRSHIVHGFKTKIDQDDIRSILSLARSLAERAASVVN